MAGRIRSNAVITVVADSDCPGAPKPLLTNTDILSLNPRQLIRELTAFRDTRLGRSGWELAATLIPFLLLCGFLLVAVQAEYYIALILTPLAGLFQLRLFIIQHDCGHGSFLPRRSSNDWLGRALGVLTFTPYDCWRRSHALHHSTAGNLDARGFGDVDTLTVREFNERTPWQKLYYRLYRHPLVLLGIGPAYLFLFRHRLPIGLMKEGSIYWVSAMATNAVTALVLIVLANLFGFLAAALVFVPVVLTAASIGVWLFYIQHQFENAHWDQGENWSFHDSALQGSSHLDLPLVLRWFTANIGVHHVHHLASRIPFYRLPEVLIAYPRLHNMNRFTVRQTLKTLDMALWDEDQRKLVTFRDCLCQAQSKASDQTN